MNNKTDKNHLIFKLIEDSFISGMDFFAIALVLQIALVFLIKTFYLALIPTTILIIAFYTFYGYRWFKEIHFFTKQFEVKYNSTLIKKSYTTEFNYSEIKKIKYKDGGGKIPQWLKIYLEDDIMIKIKVSEDKDAIKSLLLLKDKCPKAEIEIYPDYCDVNFEFEKELKKD
jgi:hypothetical protein